MFWELAIEQAVQVIILGTFLSNVKQMQRRQEEKIT